MPKDSSSNHSARAQTRSAGPDRVKAAATPDDIMRGSPTRVSRGGKQIQGTVFYDGKGIPFRKINNADPGAKNV